MDQQLKSNLMSGKQWLRFIYMVFFAVCLQVAGFVMWVLVGLQFLFALITGADNANLRGFGQSLSRYIFQALKFLTYNSEEKPFPFADWPRAECETVLEGELQEGSSQEVVAGGEAEIEDTPSTEPHKPEQTERESEQLETEKP